MKQKCKRMLKYSKGTIDLRSQCLQGRVSARTKGIGSYRTRYCTLRRASARKQKTVKENGMSNTIKTPQTRKMPARQKIANSMKGKNEPPAKVSSNIVTKRCIIQVEPLVLNDVVITPLQTKRRASCSIPEESNVTPKRSKLNSPGNKELKVSVLSLRQSFHMCEVLEKVSESDSGEDASDNASLFIPSDTSGSSDDDDNDDDDNNDDHSHNDNENDESANKPGRTLRSAKKKPMFTPIQETPRDMCEVLEKVSESDTEEDSSDNQSLFIPSDTSGSSDDDDDDDYSHNDSEKVSESDTGEDASDNQSLFTPSDTSGSSDDDDDDDDDNNDDHSHNDNENDESTNKPGRTLRSAKKKPMCTSIQETPRDMHEGLGKASESDTEENSSDNRSLFIPSDTSGSSDDDDDDDDCSHNDSEKDESTNKPGRTLRSAEKKPMFTSVQDIPRGKRNYQLSLFFLSQSLPCPEMPDAVWIFAEGQWRSWIHAPRRKETP
ncbi:PREDICTED: RNA polymerase-associated protein LEO1-like isoform X1 [Acropora digitifera]|uniref:RNA polymerase-associated protein LEO1-like isoform X1 n=1 Tax=Acropora digitifera TaxID=70779 RepID=UPI00077A3140|nr:PREDICTED: RNA polymerase-associated protein LEO1-like isoform X1 [Acropora digitifera]